MSRERERLLDYLGHMLEAIRRIERYTAGMNEAAFMMNEMVQDAVIRNIEIVGEASHNIEVRYPEFAAAHPTFPLAFVRISVMVIRRFGERDQFGRWCCAVNGL